jgi:hypothetical protein
MGLHEEVSIPDLLFIGGLVASPAAGRNAVAKGNVQIERWTIGIANVSLPRWVLRGVVITVGKKSMKISDDGLRVLRGYSPEAAPTLRAL